MWRWDHSQDWPVIDGRLMASGCGGAVAVSASYTIDPFSADSKETYLLDHCIDGRVLYPFTGHMVLAWKTLCKLRGVDFQKTPVGNHFKNLNFTHKFVINLIVLGHFGKHQRLQRHNLKQQAYPT